MTTEKVISTAELYLSRQPVYERDAKGEPLYAAGQMLRAFCAGEVAVIDHGDTPPPSSQKTIPDVGWKMVPVVADRATIERRFDTRDWEASDYNSAAEQYEKWIAATPESPPPQMRGIYIASKTKHAERWRALRAAGMPIISTWIDEAGAGESGDLADLWRRCILEASTASALVIYREPEDALKGGWVELGAALASGVPVFAVGIEEFTIANDKRIRHFAELDDAFAATFEAVNAAQPAPSAQKTIPDVGWKMVPVVADRATIERRFDTRDWEASDYNSAAEQYEKWIAATPESPPPQMRGIYIASKTKHAERWRALRAAGMPIISTWIDEAGAGESGDLADLWRRCILEASTASALVIYREPEDALKGGWVELGAALASGVPVFAVGIEEFTIANDKRIRHFAELDDAFAATFEAVNAAQPAPSAHVVPGDDRTVDDTDTAREILNYLGIGDDASREPGADHRRDHIAKIIRARIDAAQPAPAEQVVPIQPSHHTIREAALDLVRRKGWNPGDRLGLNSVIGLMADMGMMVSRGEVGCGYPDCGCCADAACKDAIDQHPDFRAALATATSEGSTDANS